MTISNVYHTRTYSDYQQPKTLFEIGTQSPGLSTNVGVSRERGTKTRTTYSASVFRGESRRNESVHSCGSSRNDVGFALLYCSGTAWLGSDGLATRPSPAGDQWVRAKPFRGNSQATQGTLSKNR